jgi:hypothetical protein
VYTDKAAVVNISEDAHEELAVHSIGHPTMARNTVAEVLDVKSALKTGCKEPSKWSHERRKCRKDQAVKLVRAKEIVWKS